MNIYNEKLVEIECLLAHILNQFESLYKKNNEEIINKWLDSCVHINQEIKFHQNQKSMVSQCRVQPQNYFCNEQAQLFLT